MSKKHSWWRYALRGVFLALVLIILAKVVDVDHLKTALRSIRPEIFAACVALELGIIAIESWRIRKLSRNIFSFSPIWRSRLLSLFSANFLPGLGAAEVVRYFILERSRPGHKLFLALLLLANRLYGFLALPALFLFALFLTNTPLPQPLAHFVLPITLGSFVAITLPLYFRFRPLRYLSCRIVRGFRGKLRHIAFVVYRALRDFSTPSIWLMAMSTSIFTNFLSVAEMWLPASSLGVGLDFAGWALLVPLITLATFLPMGFGAIGPQDTAVALGAHLFHLPMEPFLATSIIIHGVRFVATLPGLLYLSDLGPNKIREIAVKEQTDKP